MKMQHLGPESLEQKTWTSRKSKIEGRYHQLKQIAKSLAYRPWHQEPCPLTYKCCASGTETRLFITAWAAGLMRSPPPLGLAKWALMEEVLLCWWAANGDGGSTTAPFFYHFVRQYWAPPLFRDENLVKRWSFVWSSSWSSFYASYIQKKAVIVNSITMFWWKVEHLLV